MKHNDNDTYLPVPTWNGHAWEPRAYGAFDEPLVAWPDGFDPTTLPMPPYALGQTVRFQWGNVQMVGQIREIKLSGGRVDADDDMRTIIAMRYSLANMYLTIYANGHGRWVALRDVLTPAIP